MMVTVVCDLGHRLNTQEVPALTFDESANESSYLGINNYMSIAERPHI